MTTRNTVLGIVAAAAAAASAFMGGCGGKKTLHIYTWSDYYSPDLILKFEKDNDCRVVIDTFDSNESMYAKLKAGGTGYDLVNPTSYFVEVMRREGLIDTFDLDSLPNFKRNFDESYSCFAYGNGFSNAIPYAVSYTGIMYMKGKVDEKAALSWNVFGDNRLRGRLSLMNDPREVLGAALMYNGFSVNTKNHAEIDKAVATAVEWKKNIRKFDSESYKTEVADGSTYAGQAFSSDAAQVILGEDEETKRDDIGFSLPKEGFTVSCDEFVVMKSSTNKELAHKFVNFVYDPEVSQENMEYLCTLLPNKTAIENLDEITKKVVIPDLSVMARGQRIDSFDDDPETTAYYNAAWDRIMSATVR